MFTVVLYVCTWLFFGLAWVYWMRNGPVERVRVRHPTQAFTEQEYLIIVLFGPLSMLIFILGIALWVLRFTFTKSGREEYRRMKTSREG